MADGVGGALVVEVGSRPCAARSASARRAAVCCWVGFVVLVACVAFGLPDGLDRRVLAIARPGDEWGPGQVRWDMVVEALRPPVAATALVVVAVAVGLARRSVRPVAVAALAAAVAVGVTLLVKFAVARPDPHLTGTGHGGSFPSGHTVGVVVCVGLAVQLLRPGAHVWVGAAAALAAGAVMGVALVVIGAHWPSDVLGGLALGLAVLCTVAATGRVPDRAAADLWEGEQVGGRPGS